MELEESAKEIYLQKKRENPAVVFKFKSLPIDLKDIGGINLLEGDISLFTGEELVKGTKVNIIKVIYFEELPL